MEIGKDDLIRNRTLVIKRNSVKEDFYLRSDQRTKEKHRISRAYLFAQYTKAGEKNNTVSIIMCCLGGVSTEIVLRYRIVRNLSRI